MAEFTVITLSRNREYFERLAEGLAAQEGAPETERIVVNNANDPRLTATALRYGWAAIEPGYNTSFSAGNNLAARAATGSRLLLLNDDLRPQPGFLAALTARVGQADVLGALLLHEGGTVNHAGTSIRDGIVDHIGRNQPREGFTGCPAVPSVTFAAVLIHRDLWNHLGGLDERYYYGWEDTDFCLRAVQAGATIRCCRDAVAIHDECGTRARGGAYERVNAGLFRETWAERIPALLQGYARHLRPEQVEGI